MSEFKFTCSQCGQHLSADDSWIGQPIQCPSCQAALVVPRLAATAPPPVPKLSVASSLPPVIPAAPRPAGQARPNATPPHSAPRAAPWLWIILGVVLLGVVGIAVFAIVGYQALRGQVRPVTTPPPQPPARSIAGGNNNSPKVNDPAVTTDPASAKIPDAPASGTLRDQPFQVEAATISPMNIVLKQGKEFLPDASLTFFLFLKPEDKLEGRKIIIARNDTVVFRPHIHVARKEAVGGVPKTEIVTSNYALRLEFGERQGNKLPGRIFLEMGQHLGTKVAGTFEAAVTP